MTGGTALSLDGSVAVMRRLGVSIEENMMKSGIMLAVGLSCLLSLPVAVQAQGLVGGAEEGAHEGSRAAGPVGAVVGGAIGTGVGTVNGALGIHLYRHYHHCYWRHGYRRCYRASSRKAADFSDQMMRQTNGRTRVRV
jgi:hypothetical protein